MTKEEGFDELARKHRALLFDFVITELELAITFYRIATSTSDPHTADRNAANARRARHAARRALDDARLSDEQRAEVDLRLDRLKELSDAV